MPSANRRKPYTIQFASDLHLEFERRPEDRLQLPVSPDTTALVLWWCCVLNAACGNRICSRGPSRGGTPRASLQGRTRGVSEETGSDSHARCRENWDHLYGSNLDALLEDCGPALWIHGHVHDSFEYKIGGTTVACNPRGYLGYGQNPHFDAGRCFKLRVPAS
jgi:hypothetical protein